MTDSNSSSSGHHYSNNSRLSQSDDIPMDVPQLLRGFKDILPDDEKYWQHILLTVVRVFRDYGFSLSFTPLVEDARLFERALGESRDTPAHKLLRFTLPKDSHRDDSPRSAVLRSDALVSLMRAYFEHGMTDYLQPVKLWTFGPVFRYGRSQSGQYRQFHQCSLAIIGDSSPVSDAQSVIVMYQVCKALGLDVVIPINCVGDRECRDAYIEALNAYLVPRLRDLSTDVKKQIKINPLSIFDHRDDASLALTEEAPQILDFLSDESRTHFITVLEYLDELDVPYALSPYLFRAMDYCSRTVFEVYLKSEYSRSSSKRNVLASGGRCDQLSENIGGVATSSVGSALGIERFVTALRSREESVPSVHQCDLFIAQLGNEAKRKAFRLFEELRANGWCVAESFSRDGLSAQLERAGKLNSRFTLILGHKEILDGTIIIRDMVSSIQEEVNYDKLTQELTKRVEQLAITDRVDTSVRDTAESTSASDDQADGVTPIVEHTDSSEQVLRVPEHDDRKGVDSS